MVAHKILVSAPVPFWVYWGWNWVGLGWDWVWGDWGLRGWGLGLDNWELGVECASSYVVVAHKILVSAPVPLKLIGTLNWVAAGPKGFGDRA